MPSTDNITGDTANTKVKSNSKKWLLVAISICFVIISMLILIVAAINRNDLDPKLTELQTMAENNGYYTEYIKTESEKQCFLVRQEDENGINNIIYIPDGITKINTEYEITKAINRYECIGDGIFRERKDGNGYGTVTTKVYHSFTDSVHDIYDTITIIGGKDLVNVEYMFKGCNAKRIDLTQLDTSNIEYTSFMFTGCKSEIITNDKKILDAYAKRNNN